MLQAEVSDDLMQSVVTSAVEKTIEAYREERRREARERNKQRMKDTMYLLHNYRQIKLQAAEVIASLSEVADENLEFFENLMQKGDAQKEGGIDVFATIRSNAKATLILMTYIDKVLQAYQRICFSSKKPEEQRRYRVLEAMCLINEPLSVRDIAEMENIDKRTVHKDFEMACEKISTLLFGVRWVDRGKGDD